ncbi:pyridoxine 5'-phosphate synthase [Candidatus Magnetominusculus xianensis]|uniref:Pyridoxine 5'-phosphate synthase n=1 Tax=Candidatus Magnetominusculus xianensis TaxID=1748249 RepID=A0ABR5SED3_9BACT|nr:pyridoxine 5'-phosphate synthase [Candidatus Magnetominusculus xianensis]KWT82803.1 pyridoxine 5'-phosphate synthase [Candidatus Magnetominusculus xianensis]MBF0403491.1 pyridoxine 5'-phosphate synthase [Nitrospirota bacterium]
MILSVNVDHVATVRQARLGSDPDPVAAAVLAVLGGADGITIHLREDRRHIIDRDLDVLRQTLSVPLNLEMAATDEMIEKAAATLPAMVTLVPEKRQELTTEGGLDVQSNGERLKDAVTRLHEAGIEVSLFVNPSPEDVEISLITGADRVEIHTGTYANASTPQIVKQELQKILAAVQKAAELGLTVNAGHGLNYHNVQAIAGIKAVSGLYIGHGIISRAVLVGMEQAVRQMKNLITQVRRP